MTSELAAGLFVIIAAVLGIAGNLAVLITCVIQRLPQVSPAYLLMSSIAIPDLINCIFDLLLTGPSIIQQQLVFNISTYSIQTIGAAYQHFFWTDFFHIPIVAISQALMVSAPDFSKKFIRNRTLAIFIVLAWFMPFVFSIPDSPLLSNTTRFYLDPKAFSWHPDFSGPLTGPLTTFDYVISGICVSIWIICDIVIIIKLRSLKNKIINVTIRDRRNIDVRNTSIQFIVVVAIYVLQDLMYFVVPNVTGDRDTLFLLGVSNSLLFACNFYIYVGLNNSFRKAFLSCLMRSCKKDTRVTSSVELLHKTTGMTPTSDQHGSFHT